MNNNFISKFFLIFLLILFTFIYFLEFNIEKTPLKIENISKKNLNEKVLIVGNLCKKNFYKETIYLIICDKKNSSINLSTILFNSKLNEDLILNKDYFFYGKINIYKKNLTFILNKIELIK